MTNSIIPAPAKCIEKKGFFRWKGPLKCCTVGDTRKARGALTRLVSLQDMERDRADILLIQNGEMESLGKEGYSLNISSEQITLTAATDSGLYYGIQSLRQLLPAEAEINPAIECLIPAMEIEDQPAFDWRGLMLDSCRHFHGIEEIKQILDILAIHKINRFHWHLTEDQGWRIEIKKYPLLTQIGSKRPRTEKIDKTHFKEEEHGGFFTQDQVREVIAYAADRNIMVVPEVDIPGHSTAALAAYPQYSCTGGPIEVKCTFGVFDDIYCAGKDQTFRFLQDVFDEIIDLFDSPYIHIGGDEAPVKRWKSCPDCQERIDRENLNDEHHLQTWFFNRISDYLIGKGKIPIGWNEVISDNLDDKIIVQYWIPDQGKSLEQLQQGRPMILSQLERYYIDYGYSTTTLKSCYGPAPFWDQLSREEQKAVMGIEAPLWSEWIDTTERLYWQLLPRLTAVAESSWTDISQQNWDNFLKRLPFMVLRMNALGIYPAASKYWQMEHNGIVDDSEEAHKKVLLKIEEEYQQR